jgi:hypothetical protein
VYYLQSLCYKQVAVQFKKCLLYEGAVLLRNILLQEGRCTIQKASVAGGLLYSESYSCKDGFFPCPVTVCCKRFVGQFGKRLLSVARELLYFSENILCKRVVSASVARMLLSSKVSITVLFRKCSLQEGCFSVQKVFVTGGLLFSSESVRYKRVAFQFKKCSLQEGCFSVQTVPVARGLLYNLESVRLQ